MESTFLGKTHRRFQVAVPPETSIPPTPRLAEQDSNQPASRRPWYRLHVSTLFVVLSLTGLMTILELPGEYATEEVETTGVPKFEHGWPWIYLKRQWEFPPPMKYALVGAEDRQKPPWLNAYAWELYENPDESRLSLSNLLLDLTVTLLMVAAAGALFEWRRRRRTRLIQFTLRELLLLTLLTAGVFSWWRTEHNRRTTEQELVNQRGLDRYAKNNRYMGPAVLKKLLGLGNLDDWYRYDTFLMFEPKLEDVKRCFPLVQNFKSLKILTVHRAINIRDKQVAEMASLTNLEELYLCDAKLTDGGAETLSRLTNLKKLTVADSPITDASISQLSKLTGLKTLDVSGTRISYDGCQQLKARLPHCIVIRVGFDTLLDEANDAIHRAAKKKK